MRGLRTKESNEFLRFFEKVQAAAAERDAIFFLDAGECMDITFKDMLIDEMSGWLVPFKRADLFEKAFIGNLNLDAFEEFYIWCIPKIIGEVLEIEFKNF